MRLKFVRRSLETRIAPRQSMKQPSPAPGNSPQEVNETGAPTRFDVSVKPETGAAADVLNAVLGGRRILQDFHPLACSLEWVVGQLYWDTRGERAFLVDDVPFKITNDSNLSGKAAAVFFASLDAAEAAGTLEERILVLELGVGTGLFTRFFLDEFRSLCRDSGKDYYERLCYVAADRSPQMLEDLNRRGTLASHAGHCEVLEADAMKPNLGLADWLASHAAENSGGIRAVFLNYVLDSLPATILQIEPAGASELQVETALARGIDLSEHTRMSWTEIIRQAHSVDPTDKAALAELYGLFALRYEFRPVDLNAVPYGHVAAGQAGTGESRVLHTYGALGCLDAALSLLRPDGFILINDYDDTPFAGGTGAYRHQHYGGSTALGLNVPLLKSHFDQRGDCRWIEPPGNNRHLCSRLLGKRPDEATEHCFRERFSLAAYDWHFVPINWARGLVQAGRLESALTAYRQALNRQPRNWALLTEVADFLAYTLGDYAGALPLSDTAIELNPFWPDLWNTRGDCLYFLKQFDDAHEAFERALALNPDNVRARYNLSFTWCERHRLPEALRVIAEALFLDKTGRFRDRLLQQQSGILARVARAEKERERCWRDRFPAGEPAR